MSINQALTFHVHDLLGANLRLYGDTEFAAHRARLCIDWRVPHLHCVISNRQFQLSHASLCGHDRRSWAHESVRKVGGIRNQVETHNPLALSGNYILLSRNPHGHRAQSLADAPVCVEFFDDDIVACLSQVLQVQFLAYPQNDKGWLKSTL